MICTICNLQLYDPYSIKYRFRVVSRGSSLTANTYDRSCLVEGSFKRAVILPTTIASICSARSRRYQGQFISVWAKHMNRRSGNWLFEIPCMYTDREIRMFFYMVWQSEPTEPWSNSWLYGLPRGLPKIGGARIYWLVWPCGCGPHQWIKNIHILISKPFVHMLGFVHALYSLYI